MAKKSHNQILLAQNFFRSSRLVRRLVNSSSIGPLDIVYEIGAGRGIITAELAQIAYKVIAIEKDPALARHLRERFQHTPSVEILVDDFLRYRPPDGKYKIFGNIPYNLTAHIVRKILYTSPVPGEAYLVIQKEAAEKFAGNPKATQFSILAGPWFDIQILQELRRTDFEPVPNVASAFLHIEKRCPPLIREEDNALYRNFVRYGFGSWKKSLKLNLKPVFTYRQWKRLSKDLRFPLDARPSELNLEQWLGLFDFFRRGIHCNRHVRLRR